LAAAIAHDRIGLILFDSGFGEAVDGMRGVVGRTYRRLLRPESAALASSLYRAGLDPGAVACVVVSHLDPDHVGGLAELPEATVIMDTAAWAALAGHARLWHRLAKRTLPPDLAGRVRLIDTSRGPVDLFADGTLIAIRLPGHAAGHIGLLVAARDGHRYALVGDAVLRVADLEHGVGGPYRWIARDRRSLDATVTRLRALATDGLVVVPSHCPDTADLLADGWRTEAHSKRARE
jgi:glyoxylase-like metal-dependent hydrolase (beta-lactamase superfamily II)